MIVSYLTLSILISLISMLSYAEILRKGLDAFAGVSETTKSPVTNVITFIPKQNVTKKMEISRSRSVADPVFHVDAGVNFSHRNLNNKITHCIQDAVAYNCRRYILISSSVTDSKRVISIVRDYNKISTGNYKLYCTVGVQPHDAKRTLENPEWIKDLDDLISQNLDIVLAVGKCGLDYERMFAPKEMQITVFEEQLKLSFKYNLPLFLHERGARDDFLTILDKTDTDSNLIMLRGVVHCFTGNDTTAQMYLDRGLYFNITGRICDESQNQELLHSLKTVIPLDKIMIATDAPYLTPKDLKKRPFYNGPQFIPHISGKVAHIKGIKRDELVTKVLKNVKTLFGRTFV